MFNLFKKKHRSYNGPVISFGEAAVALPLSGRLLVKGMRKGVLNQALDFSYASPATAATRLTPEVISGIFAQARKAGYHPLSLMEFAGKRIETGVEVGQPFKPVKFVEHSIVLEPADTDTGSSVGRVLYSDGRANQSGFLDLYVKSMANRVIAVTPELVEVIFDRVTELGITPLDLDELRTVDTETYVPVFVRNVVKAPKPVSTSSLPHKTLTTDPESVAKLPNLNVGSSKPVVPQSSNHTSVITDTSLDNLSRWITETFGVSEVEGWPLLDAYTYHVAIDGVLGADLKEFYVPEDPELLAKLTASVLEWVETLPAKVVQPGELPAVIRRRNRG